MHPCGAVRELRSDLSIGVPLRSSLLRRACLLTKWSAITANLARAHNLQIVDEEHGDFRAVNRLVHLAFIQLGFCLDKSRVIHDTYVHSPRKTRIR